MKAGLNCDWRTAKTRRHVWWSIFIYSLQAPNRKTQVDRVVVDDRSPPDAKIALFRSLFRGRDDIYGGRRRATGKLDVAVIQSLVRKGIVKDCVGDYGYIIVDECHHLSARSFELVVRRAKAKYVTGLSATAARKDGTIRSFSCNVAPCDIALTRKLRRRSDRSHILSTFVPHRFAPWPRRIRTNGSSFTISIRS